MTSAFPSLATGNQVTLHEASFLVQGLDPDGTVRLKSQAHGQVIRVSLAELASCHLRKQFHGTQPTYEIDKEWRLPVRQLSDRQRQKVYRRIAYVNATRRLYPVGPANPALRALVTEVAQRINDVRPPSVHSVYRWLSRYVKSGLDTRVFLLDAGAFRERKKRIPPAVTELLQENLKELLAETAGATVGGVMNTALARTARELGYPTFVDRRGTEHFVEEFLAAKTDTGRPRANRARRTAAATTRSRRAVGQAEATSTPDQHARP